MESILLPCLASPETFPQGNSAAVRVMRMYWGVGDPSHDDWLELGPFDRLINWLRNRYLGV